jgi:hypothetical protein
MGKPPAQDHPLHLWRVLYEELRRLRPGDAGLEKAVFGKPGAKSHERLAALFTHVHSWSAKATATDLVPEKMAAMVPVSVEGGLKPAAATKAQAAAPTPAAAAEKVAAPDAAPAAAPLSGAGDGGTVAAPDEAPAAAPVNGPGDGGGRQRQERPAAGTPPLAALCFSGGGIRSATFNLGVLQGLAKLGLLGRFDYLSSVSGGGYISSWLARWVCTRGLAEVIRELKATPPRPDPTVPEPSQVTYLRQYSNYLTPRLGLLSADTWTLVAIAVRNILLNWLVLLPLLTAPLLVPLLAVAVWPAAGEGTWIWLVTLAYVLELTGLFFVTWYRDKGTAPEPTDLSVNSAVAAGGPKDVPAKETGAAVEANDAATEVNDAAAKATGAPAARPHPPRFLLLGLLPRLAALPPLLNGFYLYLSHTLSHTGQSPTWSCLLVPSLVWAVVLPLLALWAAGLAVGLERSKAGLLWDSGALFFAGVFEATILAGVFSSWAPALIASRHPLYAILGPGLVIGPVLLGRTLFVALSSIAEHCQSRSVGDFDREWWARWSAWALISGVVWIAGSALVLLAPSLLDTTRHLVAAAVSAGGLGALVALLGKSAATPAQGDAKGAAARPAGGGSRMMPVVLAVAAPLFAVAVVLCLATGAQHLLATLEGKTWPSGPAPPAKQELHAAGNLHLEVAGGAAAPVAPRTLRADFQVQGGTPKASTWRWVDPYRGCWPTELAALVALLVLGFVAGYPVNINRFSMQAAYRNRLIRAYLGASHTPRQPNMFTGFDPEDNVFLDDLKLNRPFPVINITLNLVSGKELAWQERKAESFTASPLHCGAFRLGYRPTKHYGGLDGMTLGTAVATSGAAANPNMGFNSSPVISFIMTLFTVRLGAWLGNPGLAGRGTYGRSGPRFSAKELLAEAFGWTDQDHPYVSLSDGGHFEDLGLYEMVRRRCRYILVCDAGADPGYGFKDLGNAIRKIRIDFGIPIVFEKRVLIFPKQASGQAASNRARYCALADIHYDMVDAVEGEDKLSEEDKQLAKKNLIGKLIYIKPSICAQPLPATPFDVANYARFSRDFPHETTADQWFTETQFESYRALGEDAVKALAMHGQCESFEDLLELVEKYLARQVKRGKGEEMKDADQEQRAPDQHPGSTPPGGGEGVGR